MNAIRQKLETTFRLIEAERMQDMPICNPALKVKAIGFNEWGEFYLGVMLTPWFMNLMLLPRDSSLQEDYKIGSKQAHVFPSGHYEFVYAEEDALGQYQVCSLFSPVFEFTDQQMAVETASMILDEVMDKQNRDTISTHEKTVAKFWHKDQEYDIALTESDETAATSAPVLEQGLETPMSRRQLLRGILPQSKDPGHGN